MLKYLTKKSEPRNVNCLREKRENINKHIEKLNENA